jgi:hypothetical protein
MINIAGELKRALELDRDGDWDAAHGIVQNIDHLDACEIHAYLHREEGVLWNAEYWYKRANKSMPEYDLAQEWQELYGHITSSEKSKVRKKN